MSFKATKEYLSTPHPCVKCGQILSKEYLEEKNQQRASNIREAMKNSTRKIGRRRRVPYDLLRAEYHRLGSAALVGKIYGVSEDSVRRALKENVTGAIAI